jgi:hypothetical protein
MKKTLPLLALCLTLLIGSAKAQITITNFQGSLSNIVDIQNCGDNRMFVVQKTGLIRIVQNGAILPTPFINLSSLEAPEGMNEVCSVLLFIPIMPTMVIFM